MPNPLVADVRGVANGGTARVGTLDGGLVFSQIGPNIPGGFDSGRSNLVAPNNLVARFRGLIFSGLSGGTGVTAIRVYDEGGANDWVTGLAAKGGSGTASATQSNLGAPLFIVQTEVGDYMVAFVSDAGTNFFEFRRYNPRTGTNGVWSSFLGVTNNGSAYSSSTSDGIVWNGQVWLCSHNLSTIASFNPDTGAVTEYATALGSSNNSRFFVLHGRLFIAGCPNSSIAGPPTQYSSPIVEFSAGAFVELGTTLKFGTSAATGCPLAVFPISPTKVLIIGPGPYNSSTASGLVAFLLTTVGDSPTGALQATEVTDPVIPVNLRASASGGYLGGTATLNMESRIYGFTNTADALGSKRHFLYFHTDGQVGTSPAVLYEVTDETTEMALNPTSPDSDSDYAYPTDYWGGGHRDGGVDQSTRMVTVSPQGYEKGPAGVVVKCGAHGDPTVLAYHNLVGGPFTVGETITGGTSGATATVVGDGAAEGLYLRDVVGTFAPDETVTGGTSGATADLNTVLLFQDGTTAGGPFQVGETVTGGTSGATGTVTHLGIGGLGEQLVKVELSGGTFTPGETVTGGTSGATATLDTPRGFHGGAADKIIRARYFWSGGAAGHGKGVPLTGYCTMVATTGFKGTVSKGTGPGGSDELVGVVADGAFGAADVPCSFQWDFVADGLPSLQGANVALEIDRA